jgi:hypothetical protein
VSVKAGTVMALAGRPSLFDNFPEKLLSLA